MTAGTGPRIELSKASKSFGSVVAVRSLDLVLTSGSIHALIGENGAGKSTALKLVSGHLAPTRGHVAIDGEHLPDTPTADPRRAMALGVGLVHQHFMLIETMTALDNLMLGHEGSGGLLGKLDRPAARKRATRIASDTGLSVALDRVVATLSVGERQRLEILRVLFRGARALLLDEPTAVLSPVEVTDLYRTLRRLADDGHTIAVVTHRLDEVLRFCDRVTVMRQGALVLEMDLSEHQRSQRHSADRKTRAANADTDTTPDSDGLAQRLTRAIMGGEVAPPATPPARNEEAAVVLTLDEASPASTTGNGRPARGISLEVSAGEVVGVAGVEGNGQTQLTQLLAGLLPLGHGRMAIAGNNVVDVETDVSARVRHRRRLGVVVVHADRHRHELVMQASVADNLVLGGLGEHADEAAVAKRRFERFDIHPANPERLARELSGGNQQKVVMARALDREVLLFVASQPTRGVDIGTARTIQHAIAKTAADGAAVIVISADLGELRALSHRLLVMRKGQFVGEFPTTASDEELGRAMLGSDGPNAVNGSATSPASEQT